MLDDGRRPAGRGSELRPQGSFGEASGVDETVKARLRGFGGMFRRSGAEFG